MRYRLWGGIVAVLLAVLLVVHLALPIWLTAWLNRQLADMDAYHGEIAGVVLRFHRGAYQVRDLRIESRQAEKDLPLLHIPTIDLSVSWRHILRGALVGEAVLDRPRMNIIDHPDEGPDVGDREPGDAPDRGWREHVEYFFPLRLEEIRVREGTVAFLNLWSDPEVDVRLTQVNGRARNLTNIRDREGRREADVEVSALLQDDAEVRFSARFDPWGELDDFYVALRVIELDLTTLNDLAEAYLALDFSAGSGDLLLEIEAVEGRVDGYIKPLLHGLEILDPDASLRDSEHGPLRLLWEGVADFLTQVFRNRPKDRFATRISVRGDLNDPETSVLEALLGILRNAFGEALDRHLEGEGAPEE